MNTNDYIALAQGLTGTPNSAPAPATTAPVDTALEIARRQADMSKDRKPDVVPTQGAMPVAN
jgi:hypothetical protein